MLIAYLPSKCYRFRNCCTIKFYFHHRIRLTCFFHIHQRQSAGQALNSCGESQTCPFDVNLSGLFRHILSDISAFLAEQLKLCESAKHLKFRCEHLPEINAITQQLYKLTRLYKLKGWFFRLTYRAFVE